MMYYDVEFLIRSRDWTAEAVKVVFCTGPLITIIFTLIAMILFYLIRDEVWSVRIFITWVMIHAFTQSFGEIILGAILNQGFGWVLAYLYFDDTEKMVFVVCVLLAMMAGGFFLSRYLLLAGNTYFNCITRSNRTPFLVSQYFIPFLIGTGLIIAIKQPVKNGFELVVEAMMLLVLLPAFLGARYANDLFFDEEPRKFRIQWIWIAATILAYILFRMFFWKGVRI
jgi:hypothetical protein